MSQSRLETPRLSDVIMQRMESMILEGSFKPGQRLPPERELATRFGVSRPSLREAIQKLAAKGLLTSRQGGGTFVSEQVGSSFSDPLLDLLANHNEFQYDLLEFRHSLEGLSAYYAALRSTPADKERLQARFEELRATYEDQDPVREAEADAAFHLAIAEAAHNVVLLHTIRGLFNLLEKNIVENLSLLFERDNSRSQLLAQHQALLDAILAGDGEQARKMSHQHLVYVEEGLLELSKRETRLERSLRRVQTSE
ncbi:pyruvate dehydrogenase complex transcriptional repressor PdhR [Marinobacter xestospongiae]|uniref:Pyruvate dehydrogenase complex repressor n=1 Tax=Marinobacter xestospongiae TaxID=994319 RepID=A0ABU3VUN4_9GAMM|nr:pyruvate dehydrogenase complex transcriptional repressor PdhR [Marinobacter xestospongiae]MDV2077980.1 pyruvate dehydrogenase complex transcriptional repressor PdhR [Marinobacter xestospongiae]